MDVVEQLGAFLLLDRGGGCVILMVDNGWIRVIMAVI